MKVLIPNISLTVHGSETRLTDHT